MRSAVPIHLTPVMRQRLEAYSRGRQVPARISTRARIVLMAADGARNAAIAARLSISRPTVQLWRDRFAERGMAGVEEEAPRPGRKLKLSAGTVQKIITATVAETPSAAKRWSVRSMAKAQGVSRMAVQRIWAAHHIGPGKGPTLFTALLEAAARCLNPALDHRQATFFAAIGTLDARTTATLLERHRHRRLIRFLRLLEERTDARRDLHLILEAALQPAQGDVGQWLERHPRCHLHCIPAR